ncbi:MAG: transposase [Thermodesulfobacteriota bacterium]|nr:transposase [Thermodesulfobacteriota bacterium]
MDRGYNDKLFAHWTDEGIFSVTRLKENADFKIIKRRKLPKNRNILDDQLIRFNGYYAKKNLPHTLPRVVVWDYEKHREIVLLTNYLEFGLTTIYSIYKDRWQIELFFKALKQNLKVKTFVGTSRECFLHSNLDSTYRDAAY